MDKNCIDCWWFNHGDGRTSEEIYQANREGMSIALPCDECSDSCYWWNHTKGRSKETKEDDKVNHPSHYTFGEIEVIDYIKDKLSPEAYQGYCEGNILKYVSRWNHKDGLQDLEKARVYLGWMIENVNKNGDPTRKNSTAPNEKE